MHKLYYYFDCVYSLRKSYTYITAIDIAMDVHYLVLSNDWYKSLHGIVGASLSEPHSSESTEKKSVCHRTVPWYVHIPYVLI